jgi:hypothetical protein
VHGCFWGMFCNSGLIQEYPIRFKLDRRTSSHYALLVGDIQLLQGELRLTEINVRLQDYLDLRSTYTYLLVY